jgi:acyl phosphate:glycerol-3-phosphate acyltransferase
MEYAAALAIGYVLGALPVALTVARAHGVDLREVGDGNPGAWNALTALGSRRAVPVFIGDGLKGLLAGLAGGTLAGPPGAYAGVAGAMIGHAFPVFSGFRGGKSVMAFAGGAFAFAPLAALIALCACAAVSLAGSFRWGARVGVWGLPLAQLAVDPVERVAATGGLMALIGLRYLPRLRLKRDRSARARSGRDAGSRA